MQKKDISLGIINGITIWFLSILLGAFLIYVFGRFIGNIYELLLLFCIASPAILYAAELILSKFVLKKSFSGGIYTISVAISILFALIIAVYVLAVA